jgi:hypothetical protein
MPRYLVERVISHAAELTPVELEEIIQQSLRVQKALGSRIQWIQAIVMAGRMVCLFTAENEGIVKEHARLSGLPVSAICEVSAVIGPALNDFETL